MTVELKSEEVTEHIYATDVIAKFSQLSNYGELITRHFLAISFTHHVLVMSMGVATFRTADEMPEPLRKALPNIEELKKLL